jgi:hypothetical protein
VAPDSPVCLLAAALTLHELSAHCSTFVGVRYSRPLRVEPLLRWCTGQSGGTPDNPVNYSGARPQKLEGEEFASVRPWCTGQCPVAHQTVRCARPGCSSVSFGPFFLNSNLIFLLVSVEPLAPVKYII